MYKLLLVVCLCVNILSGCAVSRKPDPDFKIGVTVYDAYDTFISSITEYLQSEIEKDGQFNVEFQDARQDQLKQNEQVKDLLASGVDVLCVNLVDRTAPKKIINLAKEANVPVIFFNRELVEEDLLTWTKLYYVGARARESGEMEGEIAAEACKKEEADKNQDGVIQYVILEGEAIHQDTAIRTDYSVRTIEENGVNLEKLGASIANWNRREAQTKMNQFLEECGDSIELVIANNDDMALGAIDALQDANIPGEQWPVITGIDGTDVGLQAVKEGKMAGTVFNDAQGQAKSIADLAMRLAKGMSLAPLHMEQEKYIFLPYQIVTPENVSEYMDD